MSKGYNVTKSKKRYYEIIQTLNENIKDDQIVETIEKRIREIFSYDPSPIILNTEKKNRKKKTTCFRKKEKTFMNCKENLIETSPILHNTFFLFLLSIVLL